MFSNLLFTAPQPAGHKITIRQLQATHDPFTETLALRVCIIVHGVFGKHRCAKNNLLLGLPRAETTDLMLQGS